MVAGKSSIWLHRSSYRDLAQGPLEGHLPGWARTPEHQIDLQDYTTPFSPAGHVSRTESEATDFRHRHRFGKGQVEGAASHHDEGL